MIDILLYLAYFLIFGAILLVLSFGGWFMIKNFKKSRNMLLGMFALIVLFFISYIISSSEVYEKFQIGATLSKTIGGVIILLYVVFIGTVVSAIYSEISKLFK